MMPKQREHLRFFSYLPFGKFITFLCVIFKCYLLCISIEAFVIEWVNKFGLVHFVSWLRSLSLYLS